MKRGSVQVHLDRISGTLADQRRLARSITQPILIEKVTRGYLVEVLGAEVARVPTKEKARQIAHAIGRYRLLLGDHVYAYVRGW